MDPNRVRDLRKGDEVYWHDPDDGKCSRLYKIKYIEFIDDTVFIVDEDESELQCHFEELEE